ncbi:hypothetical protein BDY19DRAFT_994426 [Irpex rosettiformis]|uniref:Uncharacterized protein n=1 Tax=Irpex rosettiformis TaxID=378272 RepID=A0ACB8U1C5_9APHY|nr:hypothetical protein BDY19DRAFT_994426 [Irpex rosettiformis]
MRLTISAFFFAVCAVANAAALAPRAGSLCVSVTAPQFGTIQPIPCKTGTCEILDIGTFSFDPINLTFSIGAGKVDEDEVTSKTTFQGAVTYS